MVFRTRSWPHTAHPRSRQRAEVCWCTASSNRRQLNSLHHQIQPAFGEHPDARYRRYPQAPHSNSRFQPVTDCRKASGIGDDNTPGRIGGGPRRCGKTGTASTCCTHCVHSMRTNPSLTIHGGRLCCPELPHLSLAMAIDLRNMRLWWRATTRRIGSIARSHAIDSHRRAGSCVPQRGLAVQILQGAR